MKKSTLQQLLVLGLISLLAMFSTITLIVNFLSQKPQTLSSDYSNVSLLLKSEGVIGAIEWSPNKEWIVFDMAEIGQHAYDRTARTSEIYLIRPGSSELVQITSDHIDDTFPTWSPDSQSLAFSSFDPDKPAQSYLRSFNLIDNTVSTLFNCEWRCLSPSWSPNGNWIAFQMAQGDLAATWGLWLRDTQTRQANLLTLISFEEYSRGLAWSQDSTTLFYVERRGATKASPPKIVSFVINNHDPSYQGEMLSLKSGTINPTLSITNDVFAYVSEDIDTNQTSPIRRIFLAANSETPMPLFQPPPNGLIGDIALSPNGAQLAFVYEASELYIADIMP
jgi:Tol biopolymer transport system component